MVRIGRTLGALGCVIVVTAALAACSAPESTPSVESAPASSTPTADAGRAAFEAAEATYRAYIDAINQLDFANTMTFERVYAFSEEPVTGVDRKAFAEANAKGIIIDGETIVVSVKDARTDKTEVDRVVLEVCNDLSAVTVTDEAGNSIVSTTRDLRQVFWVELAASPSAEHGYVLSERRAVRGGDTC